MPTDDDEDNIAIPLCVANFLRSKKKKNNNWYFSRNKPLYSLASNRNGFYGLHYWDTFINLIHIQENLKVTLSQCSNSTFPKPNSIEDNKNSSGKGVEHLKEKKI